MHTQFGGALPKTAVQRTVPTRSRIATRRVQAQPIAAPPVDASPLINSSINSIRLLAVDAVNKSKSGEQLDDVMNRPFLSAVASE